MAAIGGLQINPTIQNPKSGVTYNSAPSSPGYNVIGPAATGNFPGLTPFSGDSTNPLFGAAPTGGSTSGGGGTAAPTLTSGQLQAQQDFASGQTNATNLINAGISGAAGSYQGSILDYLDSLKQQQNTINSEHTQNQLARIQGNRGVNEMISHGIQSGGVTLANDNAANSSASGALARAYATLGRQQLSGVGNQFAQAELKPNVDQTNLETANTAELRHSQQDKTTAINSIVNDASQKLGALNQMALYASIPDRINIDQQIQQIKQQALDSLSSYDQTLSAGIAGVTPATNDQTLSSAANLANQGIAPANAFQFTNIPPPQVQGTGPTASELPIFTFPGNKKQTV